ncbi:MAG: hypothetical protein MHPSP_000637 [Paramarteilia canceri]
MRVSHMSARRRSLVAAGGPAPSGDDARIGRPTRRAPEKARTRAETHEGPSPRDDAESPVDPAARSAEPILVPKVRIYFAEFPSPLSAVRPEAANLGDLIRFSVRSRRHRARNLDGNALRPSEFSRAPNRHRRRQRPPPFSAAFASSPGEPTPRRCDLDVGREPTPARFEASSDRMPLPTVSGRTWRDRGRARTDPTGRRGAGILAGVPFVARGSSPH